VLASGTVDAKQALADLVEISSQIRSAVLVDEDDEVAASTFAHEEHAKRFAQAAGTLFAAAQESRPGGGKLTQLEAATAEGSVFVVRDGKRSIAATTAAEPTVALVFYDLKTCLKNAAPEEKPKRARRPRKKAEEAEADAP
jgi:predicted regulator of Ras-like GTPase activity (Roadblock/LC7/MglB family)